MSKEDQVAKSAHMMNNKLPPGMTSILDDLDYYADIFMTAFWPNSDDVDLIKAWLRHDLDKEVIEKISQHFSPDEEVNVMGVGSGDGSMDSIIIDRFRQKIGKLRYTVVEPGNVIEKFKNMVKSNNQVKDVAFDWKNSTLGKVCREATSYKSKFAFISAIHSAYYFDDLEDSLSYLLDFLVEGGTLVLIAKSDDNSLVKFTENLSWKVENTQYRLTENVAQFAEANALPFLTFDLPAKINVTSCFDEGSEVGGKLLDFLTEIAYFRKTASSDIKKETMSVMKYFATQGDDGKLYFETNCKAIVMFKPHTAEK